LAQRLTGRPDLNGDGVPDANQNAVTTMAWTRGSYFTSANNGQFTGVPSTSVVTVVANEGATGNRASSITQLINFAVLPVNRDGTGGLPIDALRNAAAPWDALAFSLEPLQSLGLVDIDPQRPGLQQRVTIDISASGVKEGQFLGYVKWISPETIRAAQAAGVTLVTLDGVTLSDESQAGWYDFTRRSDTGDGARYIVENGTIKGIELILTDNAFGDIDFTVGRFTDPGMPVSVLDSAPPIITGPTGGPGALLSQKSVPENTTAVFRFTADEPVTWSMAGGADAALFSVDAEGNLTFQAAPDFELPKDLGRDNLHEIILRAVDGVGNVSTQQVQVRVTDVLEPVPMYCADLRSGDRMLSTDASLVNATAQAQGGTIGVEFWVMPKPVAGWVALRAWQNVLTGDLFYAPEGTTLPYECYVPAATGDLGYVPQAGKGAFDLQFWMNSQGLTQIVSAQTAQAMGLQGKGYTYRGVLFASAGNMDGTPISVDLLGTPPVADPLGGG
jgi:hypothetical protein